MQELIDQYIELRNLPDWTSGYGLHNGDIFKIIEIDEFDHVSIQCGMITFGIHPGCYTLINEPIDINELLELL